MCTTGRLDRNLRPGLFKVKRLGTRLSDVALLFNKSGPEICSAILHGRSHMPLTAFLIQDRNNASYRARLPATGAVSSFASPQQGILGLGILNETACPLGSTWHQNYRQT